MLRGVGLMDAETLLAQFREAAEARGYTGDAGLGDFAVMKVKWVRTSDWIHLTVSDYLLVLSPEAAREIADGLFARIAGEEPGEAPISSGELSSEAFAEANAGLYAERLGLSEVPGAWGKYLELAAEQGAELPAGMRVYIAPAGFEGPAVSASMRTAAIPKSVAKNRKAALKWIEAAAVTIGEGHCGLRREEAPKRYVEVA